MGWTGGTHQHVCEPRNQGATSGKESASNAGHIRENSKDGAILCCETVAFVHQRLCCGGFVSLMRGVAGVLIADAYASGVAGALLQLVSCCLRHCLKKNFLTVLCSRWDLSPLGWNPHSLHWKHGVLTSGLPRDWNAKIRSQETPGVTSKFGLGIRNEAGQRLIEFYQEKALLITSTLFQQHKRRLYTWTAPDG
ncbi:uncharacterized protein LOC129619891 isoform X4 [Bubalus kerabau]|uniref:uncharacterized protein LOC129619891 isoform X4 n=1 Tax=Bubalus carabanensis TaxID=3119969 RepID=UPI00244EE8BC|nr:uncharacterized protein LOC129619891 isoform X4 [Bubalus carabanensis]XP_055391339.1 uncharacterized protein LOC129619891 isoform X4 [Bubalus carabanensis]XP_055391340.1 uncharacterized protein LOC129619891 isoform X4 [Bubalus carabanensis]XP_055391341.1 uncharacterized protein LOC129619891 isoform X4 [Bubalus carabanensis]XP_055391342.1 uncharacterized protein LOC129619891 isoform X4 [Bubalus carabanensis]